VITTPDGADSIRRVLFFDVSFNKPEEAKDFPYLPPAALFLFVPVLHPSLLGATPHF
jgi:hypothetical protein